MSSGTVIDLRKILEIARFAPSVHNTQPWHIEVAANRLTITLDPAHVLKDGDPTGRETTVSLGIFTEALIIAAGSVGYTAKLIENDQRHVVLELETATPDKAAIKLAELLPKRRTDRSIYKPVQINSGQLEAIKSVPHAESVTIHASNDRRIIDTVADLTAKGIGVALSSPSFRRELSGYLVPAWSGKKRGISVGSLFIPWFIAAVEPWLLRHGIGLGMETRLERRRWLSASGLVVITARGDTANYWFEVGRAYLQASLAIENQGLAQATSAAIVEASNYHDDVEALLDTKERVLAIMRIGAGSSKKRYSPRLSPDDFFTSN